MKTTPVTGEPPVPPEAIYPALLRLYQEADAKYNAGLFDFSPQGDTLCPKLTISDKALKPILQHLYYPDSPYEFSVLGADILGAVYEQFLGKVIRLTPSGLAKVEEKPEVKKAGGVYYTPRYIVDYIVEHTVREALDEAGTPEKASSLRILDPACGSGSFLLGAYDCLLNWHLRYYTENDPETFSRWEGPHGASSAPSGPRRRRVARAASPEMPSPPLLRLGDEWRLSSSERKRILLNNLYGVDLDPQAVEVTKLNLLLKCMEGDIWPGIARQLKLLHDRVLPNIDGNIKCGNSLIGPDYFRDRLVIDPDEHRRVRPFDWNAEFPAIMKAGGFDCVIGNPPYIRIQNLTEFAPEQPPYLRDTYRTATKGNYDIYVVFVERALALGRRAARLGFILPNKFFATDYGAELRRLLAGSHSVRAVVDFGHAQVFEGPTTYTCILLLHKEVVGQTEYLRATRPEELRTPGAPRAITLPASGASWQFLSPDQAALDTKLRQAALALLAWPAAISRGSSTGADDVFMLAVRDEDLLDATGESIPLERELTRIPVFATDFGRYRFSPVGAKRVLFPYLREGGAYRLLAEDELRISYPHAYEHLRRNRGSLQGRRHSGPWYAFSAPRNLAAHERAQLLVPLLADRGSFALLGGDPRQLCLMASGGFSIQGFRSPYSPMYALGLLNSAVLFWLLGRLSNVFRAGWITCTKQYVGQLPIRPIDFSDPSDVARHDKMVALVGRMLDLHKRLPEAKTKLDRDLIERQIAATDDEIDALVYELYGLTDEEIAIVRGET
ncbi:MAG: restriction endonuclease subunit M [Armatimonadetes bacterium]|nr:restriction endonuclease subunit M [Armatimonadota bacterium]